MSIFDSPDEAHKLYLALGEYINRYGLRSPQLHTQTYDAAYTNNHYTERETAVASQCIPSFVGCIKR